MISCYCCGELIEEAPGNCYCSECIAEQGSEGDLLNAYEAYHEWIDSLTEEND